MDRERMKALTEAQFIERAAANQVALAANEVDVQINERAYKLVKNYRSAFDIQKLAARFSDFLEKYDYIVGDIAADQLRLRGFYKVGTDGVARSQQINTLQDYLYEEVNFGAPYFVLENLEPHDLPEEPEPRARKRTHNKKSHSSKLQAKTGAVSEKRHKVNNGKKEHGKHQVTTKGSHQRRRFQIKERNKGEKA